MRKKKARGKNLRANTPSRGEIEKLLDHYQKGRFSVAEKLARSIIEEFPQHQFAWKALGAVFKATGRKDEALEANCWTDLWLVVIPSHSLVSNQ